MSERMSTMEGLPQWPDKWASKYRGPDGLYELRLTFNKVPYRPLFTKSHRLVILLHGAIEQNGKIKRSDLETAERRRKEWEGDPERAVRHTF